ncbi:MAG: hypothetical protein SNJ84_00605 [Verrucomicrobiia bacterium]
MSPLRGLPLLGPGLLSLTAWISLACLSHTTLNVPLPWFFISLTLAWIGLAWAVSQVRPNTSWADLLSWAFLFRLIGWSAQPIYEDDYFRYLWDGFRFWQDGSPYGTAPAQWFGDSSLPDRWQLILDQINYPSLSTIYGPACQLLFALAAACAPGNLPVLKLLLLLTETMAWFILYRCLRPHTRSVHSRESLPLAPRSLLLLSWCPLLIFEGSFQAHIDLAGFAALLAAWALRHRAQPMALGIALSLAVGVKLYALLFVPFLLWRQPPRSWIAFGVGGLCLYGFFWFRGGGNEWSSLKIMSQTWEFNSWFFPLLELGFAEQARLMALLIALIGGASLGLAFIHNRLTLPAAIQLTWGLFLLVSPVINPWYLLWFLPWAAFLPTPPVWTAMVVVALGYITGLNLGDPTHGLFSHPWPVRLLQPTLVTAATLLWLSTPHRKPQK